MRKIHFPEYSIRTLSNGVKFVHIPQKNSGLIYVGAKGLAGSFLEIDPEKYGVAHVLEHVVFQGTKSFPDKDHITKVFDFVGASHNAATGRLIKRYFMETDISLATEAVRFIVECICSPILSEESFEREKKVIVEEIKRANSNPERRHNQRINALSSDSKRLMVDNMGTEASVTNLTLDDLKEFYKAHYHPKNFIFWICGDITVEDAEKILEEEFKPYAVGDARDVPYIPLIGKGMHEYEDAGIEQSKVTIMWPIEENEYFKNYYALQYAAMIVGGMSRSRLFKRIREELRYTYSITMSVDQIMEPCPSLYIDVTTSKENVTKLIEECFTVVNTFSIDGPTDEEFERALNQNQYSLKNFVMDEHDCAAWLTDKLRFNKHFTTPEAMYEKFFSVTKKEIQDALTQIISREPLIVVTHPEKK